PLLCSSPPCSSPGPPRALPSFPTRRSSDLLVVLVDRGKQVEEAALHGADEVPLLPLRDGPVGALRAGPEDVGHRPVPHGGLTDVDRKSTRLNSSHVKISYAVFCLKKKTSKR